MVCAIVAISAKPSTRKVVALAHHADNGSKLVEVDGLRRKQWVLSEKRNDAGFKIIDGSYREPVHRFPMIIVPIIATDVSASEELLQEV
jgi:hypothetical protein